LTKRSKVILIRIKSDENGRSIAAVLDHVGARPNSYSQSEETVRRFLRLINPATNSPLPPLMCPASHIAGPKSCRPLSAKRQGGEDSLAVEQFLRPADSVSCDGSSMQRRLPRRFDLLCSHLHSTAQGGRAARKVPPWWRLLPEGVRHPGGGGRACLWVWLSPGAFQLQVGGPGVEGGDVQLPLQGHRGHHNLPAGRSSLGSPVLPMPLPTIGPLP